MKKCSKCDGELAGVEYEAGDKYRYDGVSEWWCTNCKARWGKWCEQELSKNEVEPPFCTGLGHPRVIDLR